MSERRVPQQQWTWGSSPYSESGAKVGDGGILWFNRDAAGPSGWEVRQSFRELLSSGPPPGVPDPLGRQVVDFLRPYFPELASPPREGHCQICGDLPPSMSFYVDRGGGFPPATDALVDLGDGLRHCPQCRSFFSFGYHSQYQGTGTLDQECYSRLSSQACQALAPLVFRDAAPADWAAAVEASLRAAGDELTLARLRSLEPEEHEDLIPGLVAHYFRTDSSAMLTHFDNLLELHPEQASRVIGAIEALEGKELPHHVGLTLQHAKRVVGKARRSEP